jgi:CheY-like chemotaxis protein
VTRAVVANCIDVVVIDVSMPTLSGDKLATLLRQNPRCKDLGVVLISGRAIGELERLAQEVEADAVVTKVEARTRFLPAVEFAARLRGHHLDLRNNEITPTLSAPVSKPTAPLISTGNKPCNSGPT